MSPQSTTRKPAGKPKPDAPPFAHKIGRWAMKINGRFVYLGSLADDPDRSRAHRIWFAWRSSALNVC